MQRKANLVLQNDVTMYGSEAQEAVKRIKNKKSSGGNKDLGGWPSWEPAYDRTPRYPDVSYPTDIWRPKEQRPTRERGKSICVIYLSQSYTLPFSQNMMLSFQWCKWISLLSVENA